MQEIRYTDKITESQGIKNLEAPIDIIFVFIIINWEFTLMLTQS